MTDLLDPEVQELLERLADVDPGVRRVAVLDFADIEDEAVLPALAGLLRDDPDATLRAEAARALAGWDVAAVVDALAAALSDTAEVSAAAAQALTELKDPRSGERLLAHAASPDSFVSAAALRALRELRVPAAAAPALAALQHANAGVRREAVAVLGWLKHGPALPLLTRVVAADADAEVRRAAAGALGLAAPEQVAAVQTALCEALADSAWTVREEAASTLGKLRAASAAPALRDAMADDYWQVRLRAARALGRIADRQAVPVLGQALIHPAGNLRKEAAIALGDIGDAAAAPLLQAAATDPDPEVRKAVRLSLQRLGAPAGEDR